MNATTTTERHGEHWLSRNARDEATAILCKLGGVIEGLRGIGLCGDELRPGAAAGLCWVGSDLVRELRGLIDVYKPDPDAATSATGA